VREIVFKDPQTAQPLFLLSLHKATFEKKEAWDEFLFNTAPQEKMLLQRGVRCSKKPICKRIWLVQKICVSRKVI
jgi:hypothetical protein